jgi:hypothetical protein
MAMAQITLNELIMAIFLFIEVPPLIFYYKILEFFARKKFTHAPSGRIQMSLVSKSLGN